MKLPPSWESFAHRPWALTTHEQVLAALKINHLVFHSGLFGKAANRNRVRTWHAKYTYRKIRQIYSQSLPLSDEIESEEKLRSRRTFSIRIFHPFEYLLVMQSHSTLDTDAHCLRRVKLVQRGSRSSQTLLLFPSLPKRCNS